MSSLPELSRRLPRALAAGYVLALLGACATSPARGPAPAAPRWPEPPQAARIVWSGGFPDERAAGERSVWHRIFEAIVGLESSKKAGGPVLVRPFGVAASDSRLLIADPDGQRVLLVRWREGTFERLSCRAPWVAPMAVAFGPDGAYYVADAGTGRVVRHTASGCTELGAGELQRPSGLALWGDRLYVADPPRHAVVGLSLKGEAPLRFGAHGSGEGELNFPTAVAVRPDGKLLVVDALNFRVVTYSPEGVPLASFGRPGERQGAFARPKGVAVDESGAVYVSDAQLGAVLVFTAEGTFELAFGGSGREPFDFSLPAGVAVAGDKLFVADAYHHRVEMYDIIREVP